MRVFFWFFIAAILFLIALRWLERFSVYFPGKNLATDPGILGLRYEDVFFETADGKRLNGWYVPAPDADEVLLFCHGNAGNISHRLEKISLLHELGFNVFLFDYRGYGKSQGVPSESGIYRDGEGAYEYLTAGRGIPGEKIILYGESLGGAVVIDLAGSREVKGLITEGTFTSAKDMARIIFPFIPHWILASKFDSLNKIKSLNCPKLIIHGQDDEIVPYGLGEKLFEAASTPKKFLSIKGGHNAAFSDSKEAYLKGIMDFLKDLNGKEA